MKVLFLEVKMDNLHLRNSQKRAQVVQSWPKKGEKGYFKSESRQPRITKSSTIVIDRSPFVSRNVQVEEPIRTLARS